MIALVYQIKVDSIFTFGKGLVEELEVNKPLFPRFNTHQGKMEQANIFNGWREEGSSISELSRFLKVKVLRKLLKRE